MKKLIKKFGRTDSILTGILLFIVLWIIVLLLFVSYVIKSTDKNWESIQTERIAKEKAAAEKYFNSYQNSLNEICEKTVKNHLTNIFRKLHVSDRTQAVLYAIKNKMVKI